MSTADALRGICTYFGGTYDEPTRTYRTSPIPGVGVVRRASPADDDHNEYFNGQAPGARSGCVMLVTIYHSDEFRIALGGEHGGWKQVNYRVELACFLRTRSTYAEDGQDGEHSGDEQHEQRQQRQQQAPPGQQPLPVHPP